MGRNEDRTSFFLLADRVMGGNLEQNIRRWRSAGVSLRAMQALLTEELGVRPALETVRSWVRAVEQSNGGSEAA